MFSNMAHDQRRGRQNFEKITGEAIAFVFAAGTAIFFICGEMSQGHIISEFFGQI